MKNIYKIWGIVFIVWFIYRYLFNLPEAFDELLVKPIVFILIPIVLMGLKTIPGFEKRKTIFEDLVIGVGMGIVFAIVSVVANRFKHGDYSFSPTLPLAAEGLLIYLILSLVTSFSEEVLGRGIFFTGLRKSLGLLDASAVSSMLSLSLYLPILFIRLRPEPTTFIIFLTTSFLLAFINSILYHYRGNLVLPILLHAFWNMSVALYL